MKLTPSVLALAVLISAVPLQAQDRPLDPLRRSHADAVLRAATIAAERERAAAWAEEQYQLIPEARRRDSKALRQALSVAQEAADSLAALDRTLAGALSGEREARQALVAALESELERMLAEAEGAEPPEKIALTERARALAVELEGSLQPLDLPLAETPAVAVEPTDGPEEIALKADFLSDRAARLRSAADVVAVEMARVRRRAELHEELRRLVAEVRLFDQAGLPPPVAQADGSPDPPLRRGDLLDPTTEDGRVLVTPEGEAAFDLPVRPVEPGIQTPEGQRSLLDNLARLRADLLRRAAGLEVQAREVRSLLPKTP